MNTVQLIGNLTRDPELRTTASGTAVCTIGLAINRRKRNGVDAIDSCPNASGAGNGSTHCCMFPHATTVMLGGRPETECALQ